MTAFQTSKNNSKGGFCNQMQKTKTLISLHISYLRTIFQHPTGKTCFLLRIFVPLHRQSKEQPSCAKSRSSMTTEAGLNRWQAPVINEDHKMGRNKISVTNKKLQLYGKRKTFSNPVKGKKRNQRMVPVSCMAWHQKCHLRLSDVHACRITGWHCSSF